MRWRDVKQGKISTQNEESFTPSCPITWRIKAFLIDLFMIYVPILYITTYLILGSKEAFLHNQFAIFVDVALLGVVLAIFVARSGQTPGYKAYDIKLIDTKTETTPSFFRAIFRYICFLFSSSFLVGIIFCFFRKDRKNLHDLLSRTMCVNV